MDYIALFAVTQTPGAAADSAAATLLLSVNT
jgi:hypothetical protein